ncbi:trypsin 3A1-like [Schistocerca piceifrons]|uniref:trypsin 3A1-like n=1 Tax=Schistocerca piceifrons TaxID=274613 RepID=UPI001F5FC2BE|nr:trypsin 3A1-like [Schistocerca piceifrons]
MTRTVLVIAAACLLAPPSLAAPWLRTRGHGRILNGTPADIADFPWMAFLQILDSTGCGASIISSTWALTAAHCVLSAQTPTAHTSLRVGSSSRESGGVRLDIAQLIMHEDFQYPTQSHPEIDYDIGVVQPSEPFPLGSNIQAVNLPADGYDPPAGLPATVSGWGQTLSEYIPVYLQRADMHVVDRDTCREMLADVAPVTLGMVCAGDPTMATCTGDSGSPLVYGDTQIGIDSWSRPNCLSAATVYTSVGYYRAWIRNNTGV